MNYFALRTLIKSVSRAIAGPILIRLGLLVASSALGASAQNTAYTTIDYPGAYYTQVRGIDGIYVIGGYYTANSSEEFPFLYNRSTHKFTTLKPNAAVDTVATGVSGKNVVGTFHQGSYPYRISFLYDGRSYTSIIHPEGNFTEVTGISGINYTGSYDDFDGLTHGFFYDGDFSVFVPINPPVGNQIYYTAGISGKRVVGTYIKSGEFNSLIQHAFLYDGQTAEFTTINPPGVHDPAVAIGVSGDNVLGTYVDDANLYTSHIFVYNATAGTYTSVDVPGAILTQGRGISGSNVVGTYVPAGGTVDAFPGFFYNGSTFSTFKVPEGGVITGISGNDIVGYYYKELNGTYYHGFILSMQTEATVALSTVALTYNGLAQKATATTTPPSLAVAFTYNGSTVAPTQAGSYAVVATVTDPRYYGSTTGTLVIAKKDQIVAPFAIVKDSFYGAAPFTIKIPAADSGLAVKVSVASGPANISGAIVTVSGVGAVTLAANQPGDANRNAAPQVTTSFQVGKATQTITFPAIAAQPNGGTFTPVATASSGLPITFKVVSGPATISGSIVTITAGTGNVKLQADQAGNANYLPGTSSQTFAVTKTAQVIAFPALGTQPYGVLFAPGATASSGLPVTYSVVSGPGLISGNKLSFTGVGKVVVQGSQIGNGTYAAAPTVNATVTVGKGAQTIILPNVPAQLLGDGPIILSGVATSGLPVTYKVTGPAILSGNVITITGAGSVGVGAYQVGSALYNAAPNVQIKFTVSKLAQKITFPALGVVNVGQVVTLSATSTSGLPISYSVISGAATLSGNSITFTATGAVKLSANQTGDATYAKAPTVSVNVTVR